MPQADRELVVKAASLAQSAPMEWRSFLEAFKSYSDDQRRLCIEAPLPELQRMQGRAQQCAMLISLFEGAVKSADRTKSKPMAGKIALL